MVLQGISSLNIKNEKEIRKELNKQVKKLDWDTLAYEIIMLSVALRMEEEDNFMILLGIKLEIWEEEKANRVSETFSMENFLNKGYSDIDSDMFE